MVIFYLLPYILFSGIMISLGVLTVIFYKRKKIQLKILLIIMIAISLLFVGVSHSLLSTSKSYSYIIEITPTSNDVNYTVFLPIPDDKIGHFLDFENGNYQIQETAYGKCLNITMMGSCSFNILVDNAKSLELSMQSIEEYTHYMYADFIMNETLEIELRFVPMVFQDDVDIIEFEGNLKLGWNEYEFISAFE